MFTIPVYIYLYRFCKTLVFFHRATYWASTGPRPGPDWASNGPRASHVWHANTLLLYALRLIIFTCASLFCLGQKQPT